MEQLNIMQETENYIVYEGYFKIEDQTIYGQVYCPTGEQKAYPTVVISHGFTATYASSSLDAAQLANAGIASCIFDFRGGSMSSKSSLTMLDMSVLTEVKDLETVLDAVKAFDFVDADNMFLLGKSQGGPGFGADGGGAY